MSMVIFDIETGPLPIDELKKILPGFDRTSVKRPGEFDPSTVKCGNIGGPTSDKGLAKIAEARAENAKAIADYESNLQRAESNYWLEIYSRAALSATTGQVLAIGYKTDEKSVINCIGGLEGDVPQITEAVLLQKFWERYEKLRRDDRKMIGFNSREFDLPFIAQRSVILGISIPKTLIQNGRYIDGTFVDLRDRWGFGGKSSGSLDLICKSCGLGGKPDGVNGAHFSELFCESATRREAIDYLLNDLEITFELAERILL
jgi:3'-5' exonuclease